MLEVLLIEINMRISARQHTQECRVFTVLYIQVSCMRGVYQVPTDGRNAKGGPGSAATGSGAAAAGAADAVGSGAGAGAATVGVDTGVFNGIYLGTFPDTNSAHTLTPITLLIYL